MAFKYETGNNNSLIVDDPIYGEIIVPYPFSKICIEGLGRLEYISQNGFSQLEFPGLVNNDRLSHSVGAFHVMSLFLKRLEEILKEFNIELSEDDKNVALCSMLLHDVGHGPFSHSLEFVTDYSHEKRTTEILLGDTKINKMITKFFGEEKVNKIASFIAEINDENKPPQDSFTLLLKNLVSNQLDADRIDYLKRDAYYAKKPSNIDLKAILASVNVVVNSRGQYELVIDRMGLSSIESVLIQRFQMYRDVYMSSISMLGDYIFAKIIERYKNSTCLGGIPVSPSFKNLAMYPNTSTLDDFLKMKDIDFKESFKILANQKIDPIMAYLCDFSNVKDYIMIKKGVSPEQIKSKLREIFGDINLDNTLSIARINTTTKLYKKEQQLKIRDGKEIMDIAECSLIRREEVLNQTHCFFSPELLRLELGLTPEELQRYGGDIRKMLNELDENRVEFELKYILDPDEKETVDPKTLLEAIVSSLNEWGYKEPSQEDEASDLSAIKKGHNAVSRIEKENDDNYYDTKALDLYRTGGSLRIREANQAGRVKIKGTYKTPLGERELYSARSEIEESLKRGDFNTLCQTMADAGVNIEFDKILRFPILNSHTKRTDVILKQEKNGVVVCLSFDESEYTNHVLNGTKGYDTMIEIEAKGAATNRNILPEINKIISEAFPNLKINTQSKYERGINHTAELYQRQKKQSSIKELYTRKLCEAWVRWWKDNNGYQTLNRDRYKKMNILLAYGIEIPFEEIDNIEIVDIDDGTLTYINRKTNKATIISNNKMICDNIPSLRLN